MIPTHITDRLLPFADGRFRFDADAHQYFLNERQLTPFSSWIKEFVEPFDEAAIAPGYASKNGMTVAEVLALWQHNRWVGTMTHLAIERFHQDLPPIPAHSEQDHPDVVDRFGKFMGLHYQRLLELQPIGLELQLWCEKLGICGTLDFPAYHTTAQGVYVLDWKTNSSFSTNAGRNYRKMKGPFRDLWENKENQYSLQISFYRILLEQAGIPTAGGALVHLPPGDAPARIYQAIDYRTRIRQILFN